MNKKKSGAAVQDPPTAETTGNAGEVGETKSLNKIRDILFGSQAKEYDQRIERLEARLLENAESLRGEVTRRLDALEEFAKKELASLTGRVRSEAEAREELEAVQADEIKSTARTLGKKIATLTDQLTEGQRELRAELLAQSKGLMDEQRRNAESQASALSRETQALQSGKIDRNDLATLFTDLAMRVSGEEEAE